MPKVYLSENDRLSRRLSSWIYGEMKCRGISQRAMAEEMGISQQALSQKLKANSFSFTDFLDFVRVLEPDVRELNRLIGREGGFKG